MENIFLAFIPVFVAVDAVGVLPIYAALTEGLDEGSKLTVIRRSMATALSLAFAFILSGKAVFALLGITLGDFMVAGGIILLCIAVIDLLLPGKKRRAPAEDIGSVPIGTPLIVGPAVLTTSLLLVDQYGIVPTVISVTVNVLLAGLIFRHANWLIRWIGASGARAMSKVMALFLAAIAVMLIRKGILSYLL